MEKRYLISIVVPVYNVEDYIEKCVRSIMNQTYSMLEIILVDDGSNDRSGSICDELALEDSRIKVVHQYNEGLVRARKTGLNMATGELLGFVDGDDYIEPVMYERLYKQLIDHEADFVHSGFFRNDNQKVNGVKKGGEIQITDQNRIELIKDMVFENSNEYLIASSIWSKLFKRDLVIKCYSSIADSSSFGEDLFCLCNCFMKCAKIFLMEEAYYHYTIRDKSLSHDGSIAMLKKIGCLHNTLYKMFTEYGVWDLLKECVIEHYIFGMIEILTKKDNNSLGRNIQIYQFPNIEQLFGKRIILYGTGAVGCDYYMQIRKYVKCELVAWTDSNYIKYECDYCELVDPQIIPDLIYDVILIGVMDKKLADEIKKLLMRLGVPEEKICWKCPERIRYLNGKHYG